MHVLQSRILLRPGDFERSVAFYEQDIGLVRYRDWGDKPRRGVVYFLGGGYLELTEGGGGDSGPAPLTTSHAPVRLWLQVADAHAARAELAARSVRIVEEPEQKPWGLIEMSVQDPDGLELVIVEIPVTHPLRRRQ